MSSSPSHIPRESVDVARGLREATLHVFASADDLDLSRRFSIMGAFTILSFMVFPWLIANHQRAKISTSFGLNRTRVVFFIAAVLLGVSLWPIVMYAIDGAQSFAGKRQ